ncbi:MAG: YbaK/EbsC family protein [Bacteroidota bacterium]
MDERGAGRAEEALRAFLDAEGAAYRMVEHEPTRTSQESARARGEPLEHGAKAILLKVEDRFQLCVLSAARKLDSRKLRAAFACRKIRFATPGELMDLTGLMPGTVPPFGRPVLPFDLVIDAGLEGNPRVAFNAASPVRSVIMEGAEYLRIAQGRIADIAEDPAP